MKNEWRHLLQMSGALYVPRPAASVNSFWMRQTGVLKLLIAEDRAALRRLIRSIVDGLAGEIRECPAAEDLAGAYLAWRPDTVLIDADMTAMDSITALQWIHALDHAARVILLSNYDSPELRERDQRAGAFAYVRMENLLELRDLLSVPR
jgi:CheY-like chemotaxis protein